MEIKFNQLDQQIKKSLPAIMFISGDEPILQRQAIETINRASKKHGFCHRARYDIEDQFQWQQLPMLLQQQDLFSEKTLLDISNQAGSFDKNATEILLQCLDQIPDHKKILIRAGKLSPAQAKSKWYRALCQRGLCLRLWPLTPTQVLAWVKNDLKQHQLSLSDALTQQLVTMTHHNLTDIAQVLEKLYCLQPGTTIDHQLIHRIVTCHLQLNVFALTDAILQANIKLTIAHCQQVSITDSKDLILILWAINRMLQPAASTYTSYRRTAIPTAAERFSSENINRYKQQLATLDKRLKGCHFTDSTLTVQQCWLQLYQLILTLCCYTKP